MATRAPSAAAAGQSPQPFFVRVFSLAALVGDDSFRARFYYSALYDQRGGRLARRGPQFLNVSQLQPESSSFDVVATRKVRELNESDR